MILHSAFTFVRYTLISSKVSSAYGLPLKSHFKLLSSTMLSNGLIYMDLFLLVFPEDIPGGEGNVAFSTTNYHVFRSGLMARRVGMDAVGMGSRTKWYFWPNAAVREFVGLLTDHRVKQALVLGGMILFYVVTVFLYYHFIT